MANETLTPCLSAAQISQVNALQPYFKALKQLISAPGDVYEELYQATLDRFSEFCQTMPFSISEPEPYSLLKQQLNLSIAALKLLRGKMLPTNSDSESIAEQEPLWAYAVLTASLFTQIHTVQNDRTVMLYQNNSHQLGRWHPITGCLYEPKTYYKILKEPNQVIINPYLLRVALIGKLIPNVALRWLASIPTVFVIWWETIIGKITKNFFTQIIQNATEEIGYPLAINIIAPAKDSTLVIDTITQVIQPSAPEPEKPINPLESLITWIIQQSKQQDIKTQSFRVSTGYLVSLNCIQKFLDTLNDEQEPTNFLTQFNECLIKNHDNLLHYYRRIENHQLVQGVVIAKKYLPDILQQEKMSSDFIADMAPKGATL